MAERAPEPWTAGPVIVTGGTGHVGLAIVRAFLEAGATVIAVGSTPERTTAAGKALASYGKRAEARAVDMTQPKAVTALFDAVEAQHGAVAVLVNGAGINFNRMIRDVTPDDFDRIMAVNVKSMFLASKEACERMAARTIAGRIVNIASGNYRYARPDAALYCASKAAMEMLTRGFALEYGGHGIAINAVAPGLVDRPGFTDPQFLKVADYYKSRSSQQALTTPQDVADAVMFLASAKAARIAGETIVIDGGYSAGRLDFPRMYFLKGRSMLDRRKTAATDAIDPITVEVVRNRLDVVASEMEGALIRSAFSVVLKEGADCSCALFTVDGDTMAQSVALPQHLGVLAATVKSILRDFDVAKMAEGDVYIMNDPYDGGTHLPDITVLTPVIFEGHPVAVAASMAHHSDLGGMAIGSLPPDSTELFQEGLVLSPVQLMTKGEYVKPILNILLKNVRMPSFLMADLGAQIAAVRVGAARFQTLCEEFGERRVLACIDDLMDRAETLTRARIAEIPDGTYSFVDYIDNDGIVLDKRVKIQVALTINGSEIHVDFAGTDPQVAGAANAAFSHAACVTYYCVRCVTDPTLPNNAGCFRPISVSLPPGTLVNPNHPAALNARTMTVCRMTDVIFGCLAQAAPERVRASSSGMQGVSFSGRRKDGRAYVYLELFCGGMGARPTKDGVDYIETDITNMMNAPTEAVELEYPLRVHSMRYAQGSGGAGKYAGGLGMTKIFEVVDGSLEVTHRGDRHFSRPWGLKGGKPAMPWSSILTRTDGSTHKVPARERFKMQVGDILTCDTAGGGGYGDPLLRSAAQVVEDVLDGRLTADAATDDYGVVIAAGGFDAAATKRRREEMASARGAVTWTFDRGEGGRE